MHEVIFIYEPRHLNFFAFAVEMVLGTCGLSVTTFFHQVLN